MILEYVLTPSQCSQLLEAIERVRSRLVKKRPIEVDIDAWEETRLKAYTDAAASRRDMIIKEGGYGFTLTRNGGISVDLICVHDCGRCAYYVYQVTFDKASPLAREVLTHVDPQPHDVDHAYLRFHQGRVYTGLTA